MHLVEQAYSSKDRYEAMLNAAEILAATLALTSAGLIREVLTAAPGTVQQQEAITRQLSQLGNAYSRTGPTFGTWTSWLAALAPLLERNPELAPGLLEPLAPQGSEADLPSHLRALKDERNRASHGNKPRTHEEAALRIEDIAGHFNGALLGSRCLGSLPWLMPLSSEYQSLDHSFHVVAHHVTGNNPDFERRTFVWSKPTAVRTIYVLTPNGPVSLSPFVASRFCRQCLQHEVCYTYKHDSRSDEVLLKSFASGHEIRDSNLTNELAALPQVGRRGRPRQPS
ncbi:hypothetical protein DB35_04180 [Streptomyces abyssalis]|uniref:Uncharacterized protein n=1 Tax=Streptomyces abyssalis TaxID=933944 RepID=A0A1E7JQ83_9ACTN|nr:hypothetical protein AN215_13290 [Streptomyces abyssalis]OEU95164.1 hypothetical protein DB35_04180 [Streptomyces abyssalis]